MIEIVRLGPTQKKTNSKKKNTESYIVFDFLVGIFIKFFVFIALNLFIKRAN